MAADRTDEALWTLVLHELHHVLLGHTRLYERISPLHNLAFDTTCVSCHTVENAGGTSNTSFCSNSACHGNVYTFAGFDAPALRAILNAQVTAPTAAATTTPAQEV